MKPSVLFNNFSSDSEVGGPHYARQIRDLLSLDVPVQVRGDELLNSCFPVSSLAVSSMGAVASAIAGFSAEFGRRKDADVHVDQRLAALWFQQSIRPVDWEMPPVWDSVAGDYKTADGWIKLHTNLDHHRHAALRVLEVEGVRENVAAAILNWKANDLETEIAGEGGVAAAMRSRREWQNHPQGLAVASEPLVAWDEPRSVHFGFSPASQNRPLKGLRVLDLTRVLAGPVATRALAGFGADVLRIDPPEWSEPYVVPDVTLGKRCACLQLTKAEDRETFDALLNKAHILVHGYRPGALDKLGYGLSARQEISPGLIEISLDAYGWSGPWSGRRGFDSLVQMSSGIAHEGMKWAKASKPTPLPVQALDHATGYLMAAAAVRLVQTAVRGEGVGSARLSLARTAELLMTRRQLESSQGDFTPAEHDFSTHLELTPWGRANRLNPAFRVEGIDIEWSLPASNLGSSPARW
ncbi:MAG: CoA transferase [Gammaproteobacteria bacterium]